jgi:hypothetical protein
MASLTGCSTSIEPLSEPSDEVVTQCQQLFHSLEAAVRQSGVRDGGYAKVDGFPYLRSNRFLGSYRNDPLSEAQAVWWIGLMSDLAVQAWMTEYANLPSLFRDRVDLQRPSGEDLSVGLRRCGKELLRRDLSNRDVTAIRDVVKVPDDYQTWKRVVGLYPLTAQAFLQGVSAYQSDTRAVFDTPLGALPVDGRLVRYVPPTTPVEEIDDLSVMLEGARQNSLQIPFPSAPDTSRLFAIYAPVLEVDEVYEDDRIGMPFWTKENQPDVDVAKPVVFVRTTHTRFSGETLLQLVYSFWFPERPRASVFDLLSGTLDGITWRVTLDRNGKPILFDSMHNCGCYHMFFPTNELRLRASSSTLEEPVLIGAKLGSLPAGERVVLRIASGTHYIQDVRYEGGLEVEGNRRYAFVPDDYLRSIQVGVDSRRSLFQPNGIVSGTQRGERYFFWPMGIRDPGAMRQWGRHATAFVGRRHFDDPDLIERYFEYP